MLTHKRGAGQFLAAVLAAAAAVLTAFRENPPASDAAAH
jgi:hypothetical protein